MVIKIFICLYLTLMFTKIKSQTQNDTTSLSIFTVDKVEKKSSHQIQEFIDGSYGEYQYYKDSTNGINYVFKIYSDRGLPQKFTTIINLKIDTINMVPTHIYINEKCNNDYIKYSLIIKSGIITKTNLSYFGRNYEYDESLIKRKATIKNLELIEDSIRIVKDEQIIKYGIKEKKKSILYSYSLDFLEEETNQRIIQIELDKVDGYIKSFRLIEEGYNMSNLHFNGLKIDCYNSILWSIVQSTHHAKRGIPTISGTKKLRPMLHFSIC